MSSMEVSIHWFIARDGRQHGPVSDLEMRKLVELGHLRQTDLLWRQGFPDWRPAPAVFAPSPPSPAPFAADRVRTVQPSQTVMPRFDATGGRGAALGASATAATTAAAAAAAHGTPMGQGWPQPEWRAPQPEPRTSPQFIPGGTQPNLNQSYRGSLSQGDPSYAAPAPRTKLKRATAALVVLGLLGGGYAVMRHGGTLKNLVASKLSKAPVETSRPTATATIAAAPAPAAPGGAAPVEAVAVAAVPVSAEKVKALEANLQQLAHWKLVSAEFPDWYRATVDTAARSSAEGKSEAEVAKGLTYALAKLRQSQAEAALGASSASLKQLAVAFKNTVAGMAKQGTPVCMSFIMSGETSDAIAPIIADPTKNVEINAHFLAVFTAVAEGRKAAVAHADPADGDYKLLVDELKKAGWTQSELELFADPKGANRATPERYCQMMQDFFTAHLTIADPAVQERLLHRTLKLVVAG